MRQHKTPRPAIRPFLLGPQPYHRGIAARERDLAASTRSATARLEHLSGAARHARLAEAEEIEALLIIA